MKILIFFLFFFISLKSESAEFYFMGYKWISKDGKSAPGPNLWSSKNVIFINEDLNLLLNKKGGDWYGSYIYSERKFLYGTFNITFKTDFSDLDNNLVFSPYLYPDDSYKDGTQEIDIVEVSKWGATSNLPINFVQYPLGLDDPPIKKKSDLELGSNTFSVKLIWTPNKIEYIGSNGAYLLITDSKYISNAPMHLKFNLRFFKGKPFVDEDKTYSFLITKIGYQPYD
jgi:hypothetical protein